MQINAQLVVTVAGVVDSIGNYDGPVYEATFNNPHGIAVDANGNVYTADRYSHTIRKITPSGMVETIAGIDGVIGSQDGAASTATFNEPWGVSVDIDGNVLVADTRNNKIRKISTNGVVSTIAGSGNFGVTNGPPNFSTFGNPTGIESDSAGNIYVADHLTHIIRKIDTQGYVTTIAGVPYLTGSTDGAANVATFNRPYGLSLDHQGNILVADEWNHKIRKIDTQGIVTTIAGSGVLGSNDGTASTAAFNYPWDITVDDQGNIFVADGYNYIIRKIFPSGNVITYAGTAENTGASDGVGPLASFNGATAIAINEITQEIYVADAYNNLVRKIIDLNQGVTLFVPTGQTTICQGEFLSVEASPQIFSTYEFYINDTLVQSGSSPTYGSTIIPVGLHSIKVVGKDGSTSSTSGEVQISVLAAPTPSISIVGASTFFSGDSAILVASQADSYLWNTNASTPTITVFETGNYFVEVTDDFGCVGSSNSIEVLVQNQSVAPLINLNGAADLCAGATALLTSSYATGNQWLKNGWPIQDAINVSFSVGEEGLYQVQVTDDLGTILISDPIEITVQEDQIIDFSADNTTVAVGTPISFTSMVNGNLTHEWQIDGQTSSLAAPQFILTEPGIYPVSLMTQNDLCADTLTKLQYIEVIETAEIDGNWFVPNAFSPNGDGCNDLFLLRGDGLSAVEMTIYNQWGELIFSSSDQSIGWDGKHAQKPVQLGTYVYVVSFNDRLSKEVRATGHVTVLY